MPIQKGPLGNDISSTEIAAGAVTQAKLAAGVAGTGPAFRASVGTAQNGLSSNSNVALALTTEQFDTASCFNNTGSTVGGIPAYSFKPNVAGYYQANNLVYITPEVSNITAAEAQIYLNGAVYNYGTYLSGQSATLGFIVYASDLIYLNGTTDYLTFYSYASTSSGTWRINSGVSLTTASASLVRSA